MKTILCFFSFSFAVSSLWSQQNRAFYIGHSLSDQIPDMVQSLSDDHPEADFAWVYQWIPGAPLRWQWDRKNVRDYDPIPPNYYAFYDLQHSLPSGNFNVLVLTESVPRYQAIIDETYQYADSFYLYATKFNPGIQVYIYEVWHCLKSGDPTGCDYDVSSRSWRQRLEDDLPMWESVVDYLNTKYQPENPVCLIPVAQGLAKLYDAIQAGTVPGIAQINDLFSDDIHLNDVGKYFVACIHFAMIHQKNPVGLTNQLKVWWGGDFNPPTPSQAKIFQEIAWETVNAYPKTCLSTNITSNKNDALDAFKIEMFPNPVNDLLILNYEGKTWDYNIYNSNGILVKSGFEKNIDIKDCPAGLYFLKIKGQTLKFIKE